jgi:hypothetical protein
LRPQKESDNRTSKRGAEMKNVLVAVLLLSTLGACAIGNQHDYKSAVPNIGMQVAGATAVAAQDRRSYVLSAEKTENFVGLSRGGYGNPFDVTTLSGNPLAIDFRDTVIAALRSKGVNAEAVALQPSHSDPRQALLSLGKDRSLLFIISEWKSDTYMNTALIYDVRLTVLDKTGRLLAESVVSGRDDLGGDFINPPAHAKQVIPAAFKSKLETLLNDSKVVAALK